MKKILALVMVLALTLTGCVKKESDPAKASQSFAWIIANDSPEDTVTGIFTNKFVEEIERLSNGRIQIKAYHNGTLGGDRELVESCMNGDIPFVVQNTAPQANFISELAIFDLPMAYTNIEDLRATLDDDSFMSLINTVYSEHGVRLLAMSDQNFRVMTSNKKIESISDFAGIKIRTMENKYHLAFWQALNANPTPMAFSEVYIGLQQGTIDAQENPYEVIVSGKIYEQQDYVVKTNHLPHLLSMIVNEDFYNRLSDEDKKIVDQAAQNARDYSRQQCDERVSDRLKIIKESGTQEIELSDEVIQEMREACQDVYDSIHQQVGDELFEAYTKNMDKGE
jgi:TRAP-type transport system periplasmic protein